MRNTLENMLRAGQAELVLQEAERYFAGPGAKEPDAQWIALRAVQAAGRLRDWGQAVSWADRGWQTVPSEPEIVGLFHFYKGTALIYIGDIYRAEGELNQFPPFAAQVPKLQGLVGDVLFNLAYVKRVLGQTEREAALFAEAARAYEAAGRPGQVPGCHYEIAWGLLLAGAADEAVPYLEAASAARGGSDEPELQVKMEIASALLYSLRGALERSNHICRTALGRHDMLAEQIADAGWILGRNALKAGDRAAAVIHAEEAYAAAVTHWWPPQLDRINELKAQIAQLKRVGH